MASGGSDVKSVTWLPTEGPQSEAFLMGDGEVDACPLGGGCSWPQMEEASLEAGACPLLRRGSAAP